MTKQERLDRRIFYSVEEAIDWLIAPERVQKEMEIEPQPQKEPVHV